MLNVELVFAGFLSVGLLLRVDPVFQAQVAGWEQEIELLSALLGTYFWLLRELC